MSVRLLSRRASAVKPTTGSRGFHGSLSLLRAFHNHRRERGVSEAMSDLANKYRGDAAVAIHMDASKVNRVGSSGVEPPPSLQSEPPQPSTSSHPSSQVLPQKTEQESKEGAKHRALQRYLDRDFIVDGNDIDSAFVDRVRSALQLEDRQHAARRLSEEITRDPFRPPRSLPTTTSATTDSKRIEVMCGIGSRLYSHVRRRLPAAKRVRPTDIQFHEVLPNGRVVTLTEVHRPTSAWSSSWTLPKTEESPAAAHYLHFVLYKCHVPLQDALHMLATHSDTHRGDWSVNICLDDRATTTQTCSLDVTCFFRHSAEGTKSLEAMVRKLLSAVNLQPLPLRLQVLGFRSFPCHYVNAGESLIRCTALLRGVDSRTLTTAIAGTKAALRLSPNYFGPRRFFLFGTSNYFSLVHMYHAVSMGAFRSALTMLAYTVIHEHPSTDERRRAASLFTSRGSRHGQQINDGGNGGWVDVSEVLQDISTDWLAAFIQYQQLGDVTEGAYERIYRTLLPPALRTRIESAGHCVVWNTVLSSVIKQRWHRRPREEAEAAADDHDGAVAATTRVKVGDVVLRWQSATVPTVSTSLLTDHIRASFSDIKTTEQQQHCDPATSSSDGTDEEAAANRRWLRSFPSHAAFDMKWELTWPDAKASTTTGSLLNPPRADWLAWAEPVRRLDDALAGSAADLLFPLDSRSTGVGVLWQALGLCRRRAVPPADANGTRHGALLRPLFVSCSRVTAVNRQLGPRPQRSQAQGSATTVLSLPEIADATGGATSEHAEMELATDVQLLSVAAGDRGTFGSSRRHQHRGEGGSAAKVWAISRHGHSLVDRLPVGAKSHAPQPKRSGFVSLVLQFDFPASTYVSSVLRECLQIRDLSGTMSSYAHHQREGGVGRDAAPTPPFPSGGLTTADGTAAPTPAPPDQAVLAADGNLLKMGSITKKREV